MMTRKQLEALMPEALGGFWILPTGTAVPVIELCGHSHTARALGYDGYDEMFEMGAIRVSFCGDYEDRFDAEYITDLPPVPAFETLMHLIYLYDGIKKLVSVEESNYEWGFDSDYEDRRKYERIDVQRSADFRRVIGMIRSYVTTRKRPAQAPALSAESSLSLAA